MRKVKLRLCHHNIISCYKIDLDLSPTLLNVSNNITVLKKMFKTQKLIVVVAVETITHIELFLAL